MILPCFENTWIDYEDNYLLNTDDILVISWSPKQIHSKFSENACWYFNIFLFEENTLSLFEDTRDF